MAAATRREASGWHSEVVVHERLVGRLEARMSVVAESAREPEVEGAEGALPSCHLETSVVSSAPAAQSPLASHPAFCPIVL